MFSQTSSICRNILHKLTEPSVEPPCWCNTKGHQHVSRQQDKQYKQKTSPKSYKNEIKFLVNTGLAQLNLTQSNPGWLQACESQV